MIDTAYHFFRWCLFLLNRCSGDGTDLAIQNCFLSVEESDRAEDFDISFISGDGHQHDIPASRLAPLAENSDVQRVSETILHHPQGKSEAVGVTT